MCVIVGVYVCGLFPDFPRMHPDLQVTKRGTQAPVEATPVVFRSQFEQELNVSDIFDAQVTLAGLPAVVYTDSNGVAAVTFTVSSCPSGASPFTVEALSLGFYIAPVRVVVAHRPLAGAGWEHQRHAVKPSALDWGRLRVGTVTCVACAAVTRSPKALLLCRRRKACS